MIQSLFSPPSSLADEHSEHLRLFPYGFHLDTDSNLNDINGEEPEVSVLFYSGKKRNAEEAELESNFNDSKVFRVEAENLNETKERKLEALKKILTEFFISNLSDLNREKLIKFNKKELKSLSNTRGFEKILSTIFKYYEILITKYGFSHEQIMKMATYSGGWKNIETLFKYGKILITKYHFNHEQIVKMVSYRSGWVNIKTLVDKYEILVNKYGFSNEDIVNVIAKSGGSKYIELFLKKVQFLEILGLEKDKAFRTLFFSNRGFTRNSIHVDTYIKKKQIQVEFFLANTTISVVNVPSSDFRPLLPASFSSVSAQEKMATAPVPRMQGLPFHFPPPPAIRPVIFLNSGFLDYSRSPGPR